MRRSYPLPPNRVVLFLHLSPLRSSPSPEPRHARRDLGGPPDHRANSISLPSSSPNSTFPTMVQPLVTFPLSDQTTLLTHDQVCAAASRPGSNPPASPIKPQSDQAFSPLVRYLPIKPPSLSSSIDPNLHRPPSLHRTSLSFPKIILISLLGSLVSPLRNQHQTSITKPLSFPHHRNRKPSLDPLGRQATRWPPWSRTLPLAPALKIPCLHHHLFFLPKKKKNQETHLSHPFLLRKKH